MEVWKPITCKSDLALLEINLNVRNNQKYYKIMHGSRNFPGGGGGGGSLMDYCV